MSSDNDELSSMFMVLVNDEGQHSLWPAHKSIPAGWNNAGFSGTQEECVEHVDKVWTDITPRSVRERLGRTSA